MAATTFGILLLLVVPIPLLLDRALSRQLAGIRRVSEAGSPERLKLYRFGAFSL
jgi:hypothetical protein